MESISNWITVVGFLAAILTLIIFASKTFYILTIYCKNYGDSKCPYKNDMEVIREFVKIGMIALTIVVVAMPEGLLISVAFS